MSFQTINVYVTELPDVFAKLNLRSLWLFWKITSTPSLWGVGWLRWHSLPSLSPKRVFEKMKIREKLSPANMTTFELWLSFESNGARFFIFFCKYLTAFEPHLSIASASYQVIWVWEKYKQKLSIAKTALTKLGNESFWKVAFCTLV